MGFYFYVGVMMSAGDMIGLLVWGIEGSLRITGVMSVVMLSR